MDEYIKREEAVKKIKSCIFTAEDAWESGYNTAMAEIMGWIKHMPSADVQPVKHGRWILCDDGYVRCSECNRKAFIENDETILTDFCHGCGADMIMDGDSK